MVPNTNPNDETGTLNLVPGRYTVLDNILWCEPAFVKTDLTVKSFGPRVAICQFPMNSSCILN